MTVLPPKPVPDADTQPFWDAAADHRLVVQRCDGCGRWIWQPRPMCPSCGAVDPAWQPVSGNGVVVSWTVIHGPVLPVWEAETPFTVLLVELAEGVRMVGRLVEAGPAALAMGMAVALRWRHEAGTPLPAWAPRD